MENNEKRKTLHDYWLECGIDNNHGKLLFYLGATAVLQMVACDAKSEKDAIKKFEIIVDELEAFKKEHE